MLRSLDVVAADLFAHRVERGVASSRGLLRGPVAGRSNLAVGGRRELAVAVEEVGVDLLARAERQGG